jgi:hypothetical protein
MGLLEVVHLPVQLPDLTIIITIKVSEAEEEEEEEDLLVSLCKCFVQE